MNKKILIISIIVLVVVLALGFIVYKYIVSVPVEVQNVAGGAQVQNDASDQVKVDVDGIKTEPVNGGGTFNICLDKCGDGICQETDPKCGEDINLGCVCLETSQDCPQDCK